MEIQKTINIWVPCDCKAGYHIHGSNNNYTLNRTESRCSHCTLNDYNTIVINDDTLRTTVKRRMKTGNRTWFICNKQFEFRERRYNKRLKRGCESSPK